MTPRIVDPFGLREAEAVALENEILCVVQADGKHVPFSDSRDDGTNTVRIRRLNADTHAKILQAIGSHPGLTEEASLLLRRYLLSSGVLTPDTDEDIQNSDEFLIGSAVLELIGLACELAPQLYIDLICGFTLLPPDTARALIPEQYVPILKAGLELEFGALARMTQRFFPKPPRNPSDSPAGATPPLSSNSMTSSAAPTSPLPT